MSDENNEMQSIRNKAKEIFAKLEIDDSGKSSGSDKKYHSWIRGAVDIPNESKEEEDGHKEEEKKKSDGESFEPTKRCRFFDRNGFLLVQNFSDAKTEVQNMKSEMRELVDTKWHPSSSSNTCVFRTDEGQLKAQASNDYFLDSAHNVHYFAEKDALLNNNSRDGLLKEEYYKDKVSALNKVGHALHTMPSSTFHTYATSTKIKNLVKELGWIDPVIPQSMYIFKQSKIGGEVTSHQDSTFLYTTPKQSCLGLWLALDDATMENGCLWVRPKSHLECVRRKFVRNPDYFNGNKGGNDEQQTPPPKLIIENLVEEKEQKDICPWEGTLPDDHSLQGLLYAGFVPVECKAGDLVVFPGTLDHLSLSNASDKQRHTFQLHLVEGYDGAGVTWSEGNWLQYPEGMKFLSIK